MTANAIKSAALRLFASHGYEGTPLSAIAKEVGIKTPSLYAHFESKEKLFFAVYEDVQDEHARKLEALIESVRLEPTETKLYRILSETCRNYLLDEEKAAFLKRAMLFPPSSLASELQARFLEAERKQSSFLRGVFESGIREGTIRERDPDDLLAAYYCLLDGSFVQMFYYGPERFRERLQSVWSMFWESVSR
ncbi:TetR/AcrR family transcriptional regulator [Paenibacillus flagellatus]|uniref:TetR/AcrR family transcriptional regulator n=1 Tax=Paenibacillus flagellatus TaxID=2211139 RepID=A0A2V5KXH6_9BACL|nr:TetR/AcrR family transcriptional regulator [Paenibacillus flagellatus]PYI57137.1 TetR/AcrR family transcriptional regulator [Paenibacillus flagellatus]